MSTLADLDSLRAALRSCNEQHDTLRNDHATSIDELQDRLSILEDLSVAPGFGDDDSNIAQHDVRFDAFGEQFNDLEERIHELEKAVHMSTMNQAIEATDPRNDGFRDEHSKRLTEVAGSVTEMQSNIADLAARLKRVESRTELSDLASQMLQLKEEVQRHAEQIGELLLTSAPRMDTTATLAAVLVERLEQGETIPANTAARLTTLLTMSPASATSAAALRLPETPAGTLPSSTKSLNRSAEQSRSAPPKKARRGRPRKHVSTSSSSESSVLTAREQSISSDDPVIERGRTRRTRRANVKEKGFYQLPRGV